LFILTVRNDGLGDLILSLPTLAALRRAHPDARLGVVVRREQVPLFELFTDRVEPWCDPPAWSRLRNDRPDAVLFLRPDPAWAWCAFAARVRRRIGTRHRWQSLFFNERVPVRRRDSGRHEAECNALVAEPLGVGLPIPEVRLRVPQAYRIQARSQLRERGLDPGVAYAVVHPGSHGSSPNWPAGHYVELVQLLAAEGRLVLVTSGPRERELARSVAGDHGLPLEPTDLGTLAALLEGAATVVSGSTGPMHLAAALGVSVVALFSAHHPHTAARWGPRGTGHIVLSSEPVLRADGSADLASLRPRQVAEAVLRLTPAGRAAT
jgi:ADP-heptose:LPS heptosyltransferase